METGEDYYHSVGYGYDTINNLTAVNETINGITFTTSYAYDEDNRVTSVTSGGTERTYTYDAYSRITQRVTNQGETQVLEQNLTYRNPSDTTTTGQVHTLQNHATGYDKTYEYTYDGNGNIQTVFDGTYTTRYVYDTANQLIRENNQELGKTWTWTYDAAGNIVNRKEYAYTTAVTLGTPTDTVLYGYTDATWGDLLTSYDGTGITYDQIGNPLTDGTWTYTWEHGRQLAGLYGEDVNGGLNDVTVTYTYNADGMRIGKTVVTRTYEENHTHVYSAQIVPPTCTQQGYTLHTCACGASYKDTYVAALGHTITSGRCIRCGYVGGITPPITPPGGGEIMSVTAGDTAVVLSTGTRVLKSTRTENYKYVYNGGSLSQMVITTTVDSGTPTVYTFHFQYDASGTPMSVSYNGTAYYYATNLQGDVTAILNSAGTALVQYTYDAWGNIHTTATNEALAEANPLRYRGYVHDLETGWYYLQSRYYDPEIGRFLNADALTSTGQGFAGNNMFAYCLNNPISYTDSSGYRSDSSMIEQCIFEGCVGDTAIMKLYNRQIQSYEYNGIELYYSEEEALRAWSDIYLPLSYDCEYATLLYSIDTPLGKRYFTLDGIPGGPMQCIFPTIDLWIRDFFNAATLIAQVHTHPHPSVAETYCLSFPSANYNRSNPGDLLAKNILGFPDVYVIPYNQCLMPNFYCKLSDASTWCPHCDFLHLYS